MQLYVNKNCADRAYGGYGNHAYGGDYDQCCEKPWVESDGNADENSVVSFTSHDHVFRESYDMQHTIALAN